MHTHPYNSLSFGLVRCYASASLSKGRRRGWLNVQSGIAVNSDQGLNQTIGKPWMLDAETFGASGGTYAGLKPSLAR